MSRGTRRSAAPAVEPDEERDPSSPAQQPAASITELRQDFERFTFLQSIIGKSFMPESEAKDMYRQLTDSEHGTHHSFKHTDSLGGVCIVCPGCR